MWRSLVDAPGFGESIIMSGPVKMPTWYAGLP